MGNIIPEEGLHWETGQFIVYSFLAFWFAILNNDFWFFTVIGMALTMPMKIKKGKHHDH